MSDNKELLYAAINCAHEIDSESVILFRDPSKDGNALHQLGARLDAAAQPVVLTDEQWAIFKQITDDAEVFLNGGVAGLYQSIKKARAILAAKEQA